MKARNGFVVLILFLLVCNHLLPAQSKRAATQVVLLGTGTPLPDPRRAGPSTAIVVKGTPYIVDAGAGLVRRWAVA